MKKIVTVLAAATIASSYSLQEKSKPNVSVNESSQKVSEDITIEQQNKVIVGDETYTINDIDTAREISNLHHSKMRFRTDNEGNMLPDNVFVTDNYRFQYNGINQEEANYYSMLNSLIDSKTIFIDKNMNIISMEEVNERCWFFCSKPNRNKSRFYWRWYGYEWFMKSGEANQIINTFSDLLTVYGVTSSQSYYLLAAKYSSIAIAGKFVLLVLAYMASHQIKLSIIDHYNGSKVGVKLKATWINAVYPIPLSQ